MPVAYKACSKKCNEKEKDSIKKLAELGDMFSLAILPYIVPAELFMTKQKESADKGEVWNAHLYGLMKLSDYELSGKYFSKIAHQNYVYGSSGLEAIYLRQGKISEFCSIAKEGYEKFGFEYLIGIMLFNSRKSKYFFRKLLAQKYPPMRGIV